MSDRLKILRKAAFPDIVLAAQPILSCLDYIPDGADGCRGGFSHYVYQYVHDHGLTDNTCSMYQARGWTNGLNCTAESICQNCSPVPSIEHGTCFPTPSYDKWYVTGYETINGTEKMINALQDGPITCAINAGPIENFNGKTIFAGNITTNPKDLDHEISIVGYGTEGGVDYWHVRNSWGTSWGDNGFFKVERNHNYIGIELECAYANMSDTPVRHNIKTEEEPVENKPFLLPINDVEDLDLPKEKSNPPCRTPTTDWGPEGPLVINNRPHLEFTPEDLPESWFWGNITGVNYLSSLRN